VNFWPFSKKSKPGPSNQQELPDGVVLSGDTAQPSEQPSSPPPDENLPANLPKAEANPNRDDALNTSSTTTTEEQSTSWAAELLKPGQPTHELSPPLSPSLQADSPPPPLGTSINQAMADVLQKATGHESLFQKQAILITDTTEQEQDNAEIPSLPNKVLDDEHNTAMDYLFDGEGNAPKDFWANPPSSAAGIESGLFAPLEAISPTLTDTLESVGRNEDQLPDLPDLSDVPEPANTQHYGDTEPVDPVEDELSSLALSLSGDSKQDDEQAKPDTSIPQAEELLEEPLIEDKWLSPTLSVSALSPASSAEPSMKTIASTISLDSDIVLKPHDSDEQKPETLEAKLPPLEVERPTALLDTNNYGPLPVYEESMADELDRFGKKVILQDTRFMKNSIDHLVERYFSSKDDD
jgi:hypothetical protein